MEPLVSIVTPTHNIIENGLTDEFNLLVNLLDKQTYPNVEHIIIDKASTDDTQLLLKDYKNKGYIHFFSEPDSGKYQALNKGIMHAKGKYIAFVSCDDFFHDITGIAEVIELGQSFSKELLSLTENGLRDVLIDNEIINKYKTKEVTIAFPGK